MFSRENAPKGNSILKGKRVEDDEGVCRVTHKSRIQELWIVRKGIVDPLNTSVQLGSFRHDHVLSLYTLPKGRSLG